MKISLVKEPNKNMKIAILLAHEIIPFAGVVRPFINWAHELKNRNYDIEFLLINVGKEIVEHLLKSGFKLHSFELIAKLFKFLSPNITHEVP